MVFLVVTKLENVSEAMIKSIWWTDSYSFVVSPSVGLSGGIAIIWELGKFEVCDSRFDNNFVLLHGIWCFDKWECGMMVVYVPCEASVKIDLWGRLVEVISALDVPLCCGGNFNVVLTLEER
ncbi:hypothetical protein V6N13_042952 [Hibiscus sabdariffa]